MDAVAVEIFVLNYNGAALLDECLPSIVRAAAASQFDCRVTVVDNGSTDDSLALLRRRFPGVGIVELPNNGLCSLNVAAGRSTAEVVLLFNNDIRLDVDAVDPLVRPIAESRRTMLVLPGQADSTDEPILWTAPRCYLFDGTTYEGFKTAVSLRFGLVQATAHFAGCETTIDEPDDSASAGAALAVDREAFVRLGGFDALYLPGRIEDLDFAYRGFLAGYCGRYVPQSVAYHRGAASFGPAFGTAGCDRLALRNTLVFQARRIRRPLHLLAIVAWLPIRAARDVIQAPFLKSADRFAFVRAAVAAIVVLVTRSSRCACPANHARELEFFRRHAPRRLSQTAAARDVYTAWKADEARRAVNYPLARHWLRPAALHTAEALNSTPVQPWHITIVGLFISIVAGAFMLVSGMAGLPVAALILASWFCDRIDGPLARLRGTADRFGAWLDANVDEAVDLGLHMAAASVAAYQVGPGLAWGALIAFFLGKYLLMYGLACEDAESSFDAGATASFDAEPTSQHRSTGLALLSRLYHLPANADVRVHLFAAAAATGLLWEELLLTACYYNLRWPARYVLVARRLWRCAPRGATA